MRFSGGTIPCRWMCSGTKGRRAMCRACLMARASTCWWRLQVPVRRRGSILPRSEINLPSRPVSL